MSGTGILGGQINVAGGATLKLEGANALREKGSVLLVDNAKLDITGSQAVDKLESTEAAIINVPSGSMIINQGVLAGSALNLNSLEKEGFGYLPTETGYTDSILTLASNLTVNTLTVHNGKLNLETGKKLTVGEQARNNGNMTLQTGTVLMLGAVDTTPQIEINGTLDIKNGVGLDLTAIGSELRYDVIYYNNKTAGVFSASNITFNGVPVDINTPLTLDKYMNGLGVSHGTNLVSIFNLGLVWNNNGDLPPSYNNQPGTVDSDLLKAHGVFNIKNGTVTISEALNDNTSGAYYELTGSEEAAGWNTKKWDGKTLNKQGAGTLVLTESNGYTGHTYIEEGTLRITQANALSGTSGIQISANANFELQADSDSDYNFTGKITGAGNLIKSGLGTVTLRPIEYVGNSLAYSGETRIQAGTLKLTGNVYGDVSLAESSGVQIGGGAALDISGIEGKSTTIKGLTDRRNGNFIEKGTVILGAKNLTLDIAGTENGPAYRGKIVDSSNPNEAGSLTKTGTNTLVLGGDNTFTGGVTLEAGKLYLEHNNALGTGALEVTGAGTTLGLGPGVTDIGNSIVLTGQDLTLYSYTTTAKLTGVIEGSGGLNKDGTGTLELAAQNSFTGHVTLMAGTLRLSADKALGNAINDLFVKGDAALALGSATLGNDIKIDTGKNLSIAVSGTAAATLGGTISGAGGGITKTETGSLTLTGAEDYTGETTVKNGTLAIKDKGSIEQSSKVTVDSLGRLDIHESNGPVTVQSLFGTGKIELGDQSLQVKSGLFTGTIAGSGGGLIKIGADTLTLKSTNQYTGATEVQGGTLSLTGANALMNSSKVSVESGATLSAGQNQVIQDLQAKEGATISMDKMTLSLGAGTIEKLTAASTIGNLTKIAGSAGNNTLTFNTSLNVTDFTVESGTVSLGAETNAVRNATLRQNTTLGLGLTETATSAVLTASGKFQINGATLNITDIPRERTGEDNSYTLITASGGVTGEFSEVQFNGKQVDEKISVSSKSFHNGMGLRYSENRKTISVVNGGYVWDNKDDNSAHGTFFVEDGKVELNLDLGDRSGINPLAFYTDPETGKKWDGSTFTKTGAGTLTLGGKNTYQGDTEVKEGTLEIRSDDVLKGTKGSVVLGDGDPDTAAKGTLNLNYAKDGDFSTGITGTGDLTKTGTGKVTVKGGADITGNVSIDAGTLALAGDTKLQGSNITIAPKAAFDISGATGEGDITFKELNNLGTLTLGAKTLILDNGLTNDQLGTLSGNGVLEQRGGGTLKFDKVQDSFTGTARVDGGEIYLLEENVLGGASMDVKNGSAYANKNQAVMGLHLGGDTVEGTPAPYYWKNPDNGAWEWVNLPGDLATMTINTGTGGVGVLGELTVDKNLGGNGEVTANVTLKGGSEFAPGNSPGTLNVAGDMTFDAGSKYIVDLVINNNETATLPEYHDNLVVDGAVEIKPGSMLSLAIHDPRPLGAGEKQTIKILEAVDGVTGTFDLANDYLFINQNIQFKHSFSTVSEPNEVYVVVSRSSTSIEDITKNPNENNIVDSIKSKDEDDRGLLDDLNLIRRDDEDKLEEYLKDISGEVYGDLPSVAEDINRSLGGSIRGRFSGFHQFRNTHRNEFTSQFDDKTKDKDKAANKDRERYLPFWVNAHGVFYNHREAYGGNAAVDISGGDVQTGMEFGLGQKVYLGVAFMGGMSTVEVKERESKALFTTFGGGLYGGTFFPLGPGDLVLGLGASYGLTFGHIRRDVVSGIDIKYQTVELPSQPSGGWYKASLDETLETDYRAHAIQGILDLGWDYALTDLIFVEPYIGATWLSILTEAFQEETTAIAHPSKDQAGQPPAEAGRLALEGQAQHKYTIATLFGARVLRHFGRKHRFDVDVNWQHVFDPAGNRTKQTIRIMGKRTKAPDSGWFDVEGANADIDTFNGRLGYGFNFTPRMLLRASYDVQLGYSTVSHGAELLFEYMF